MAPRVSQQTRAVLNAIETLQRLQESLRKRKGAPSSATALKMRRAAYATSDLVALLDDIAGSMVTGSGTSVEEAKQKLAAESAKRRAGQIGAAPDAPCDPVQKSDGPDLQGCMIALYPSAEIQKKIAVRGGEAAERIHMTVVYFEQGSAEREDWAKATAILFELAQYLPVPVGTLTGTGRFDQEDGVVAYATIDIPDFLRWREVLVEQLELAGFPVSKKHTFTPHLTLKYMRKDEDFPDTQLLVESVPVVFPEIHMVQGEERIATAQFKGA